MPDISVILLTDSEHKKISPAHHTSLAEVGQEAVLRKQVRLLRSALGNPEIIVVTGYRAEEVREYAKNLPVQMVHNPDFHRGALSGIYKGLEAANGSAILIVPHNAIFNWITLYWIRHQKNSCLIVESSGQLTVEQIGVNIANGQAVWLSYSSQNKWSKIFYISPQDVNLLKYTLESFHNSPITSHELLNNLIDNGLYLDAVEPSGMVIGCVTTRKEMARIKEMESIL